MSVLVVGSLCIDHTLYVSNLPAPGETVIARSALSSFGGKGANQALAAKCAGGEVSFLACVGDDAAGRDYRNFFEEAGIEMSGLVVDSDYPTGSAFLGVESSGENSIIINPGANHALRPEHLDAREALFEKSSILLLQLEIPLDTIRHACRLARKHGVKIVINPSPWADEFNTTEFPCDVLIVNEHEAALFLKQENFPKTSGFLAEHQLQALVITQGADETIAFARDEEPLETNPPQVEVIDTVGAGDAFTGALAVALAEHKPFSEALPFANAAGALSVTKPGAQGATPTREEILE